VLSRDDILRSDDVKTEIVSCPEWGGEVAVRGMTGQQRDEFELGVVEHTRGGRFPPGFNIRAQVVALSCVGDDGKLLFTAADVDALGAKSATALCRVYDVAARLSGLGEGAMEEMAADFGLARGGSSSSASPSGSGKPPGSSSARSRAGS
jgi:hypothetical protein